MFLSCTITKHAACMYAIAQGKYVNVGGVGPFSRQGKVVNARL